MIDLNCHDDAIWIEKKQCLEIRIFFFYSNRTFFAHYLSVEKMASKWLMQKPTNDEMAFMDFSISDWPACDSPRQIPGLNTTARFDAFIYKIED